ncbi:MAG: UDP-glucose 4-epimerase GalE [Ichthyobacteriaceae bacterium]|nr:UDP-glucose 4-epimerase GalE [Ichthyobacteriaceae bacterium]
MKKILVTGGTGYIGSHTAIELIKNGYEVLIIDDLSNSTIDVLDRIEKLSGKRPVFEQFKLRDSAKVDDFFEDYDIDAVIHFAAYKAVGESVQFPMKYYKNNLVSLANVLDAMKENNVSGIVFSSSCTVYGQPDVLPVTEDTPIKPAESPYGRTKQIGEEMLQDQTVADTNLKAIALRYFNPVGAHESGENGESPTGVPNNLMPFITQTAIGMRDELKVFGTDYNTVDGTAVRDYIHVVDLAKAHVKAVERLIESKSDKQYEVFNLGTGNGFSVKQVIDSFVKSTGVELNYSYAPRRDGDIEQTYASTTKANDVLGWKAEKTLDEMTSSAWKWEQYLLSLK